MGKLDCSGGVVAADAQYLKETEETATETAIREYFITDDIKWFEIRKDWKKLSSIGYERKNITRKGMDEISIEERYFLCSIFIHAFILLK